MGKFKTNFYNVLLAMFAGTGYAYIRIDAVTENMLILHTGHSSSATTPAL